MLRDIEIFIVKKVDVDKVEKKTRYEITLSFERCILSENL